MSLDQIFLNTYFAKINKIAPLYAHSFHYKIALLLRLKRNLK